ncbi:MAG: hypothetical protein E6I62_07555 [Chloroflexi bacterium]|nr:MAG: hypothetical protein E6I62_07555 [Chloroflexota bacterium]
MTERRRDLLSLATLSLAVLILGHHLVFLTAYGRQYWAMLERTGHGLVWAITVITVALLTLGLIFLAFRRVRSLTRQARDIERGRLAVRDARMIDLARQVLRLWPVILVSAGHLSPILVFAAVAGAVALVAGLYRWRRDILLAVLRAKRTAWDRPAKPRLLRPAEAPLRRPRWVVGSRLAVRAPPQPPRLSPV